MNSNIVSPTLLARNGPSDYFLHTSLIKKKMRGRNVRSDDGLTVRHNWTKCIYLNGKVVDKTIMGVMVKRLGRLYNELPSYII